MTCCGTYAAGYLNIGGAGAGWLTLTGPNTVADWTGLYFLRAGFTNGGGLDTYGLGGVGHLVIKDGGQFSELNGDAHAWTNCGITLSNGTFAMANGCSLWLHSGAFLEGAGTIRPKSGTCYVRNQGGYVRPGGNNGFGTLNIISNFDNAYLGTNGTIEIELGGTNTDLYDRVLVNGAFTAGGTCTVSLATGYMPGYGHTKYDILDWTTLSGQFGVVNLPVLDKSGWWITNNFYVTGEIEAVIIPKGTIFGMH